MAHKLSGPAGRPGVWTERYELGVFLIYRKKFGEAIEELRSVLDEQRAVLGDLDADTRTTLSALASAYSKNGDAQQAVEHHALRLRHELALYQPSDSRVLAQRDVLAEALCEAGRLDEAIEQYRELAASQEQLLGTNDRTTLYTRFTLAKTLLGNNEAQAATEEFQTVLHHKLAEQCPTNDEVLVVRDFLARALRVAVSTKRSNSIAN